jgi:hypothetical protein
MGYNPHENVCEWFDFECMCKNDRNVHLWYSASQRFNDLAPFTVFDSFSHPYPIWYIPYFLHCLQNNHVCGSFFSFLLKYRYIHNVNYNLDVIKQRCSDVAFSDRSKEYWLTTGEGPFHARFSIQFMFIIEDPTTTGK